MNNFWGLRACRCQCFSGLSNRKGTFLKSVSDVCLRTVFRLPFLLLRLAPSRAKKVRIFFKHPQKYVWVWGQKNFLDDDRLSVNDMSPNYFQFLSTISNHSGTMWTTKEQKMSKYFLAIYQFLCIEASNYKKVEVVTKHLTRTWNHFRILVR